MVKVQNALYMYVACAVKNGLSVGRPACKRVINSQHQNIQFIKQFLQWNLLKITDMPWIPELLAFDKNKISKAEMKHVLRHLKSMAENNTLSVKKGYIDLYLPELGSAGTVNDYTDKDEQNCTLLCEDDSYRQGKLGKRKASTLNEEIRKRKQMKADESNKETKSFESEDIKKKELRENAGMENERSICKTCSIISKFADYEKTSTPVNHMCKFVPMENSSQLNQSNQSGIQNSDLVNNCKKMVQSFVTMVTGNDERQNDRQNMLPPLSKFVGLDCEFVGAGHKGSKSLLGRCSIVDNEGTVIYDSYCSPLEKITDYRMRFSGLTKKILKYKGRPFNWVQKEVKAIIKDKIVVGHAVHNDFKVLKIDHPRELTRDTSHFKPLTKMSGTSSGLRHLTKALLGREIQTGRNGHCSIQDAKASLDLYMLVHEEWEEHLAKKGQNMDQTVAMETEKSFLDDEFWPNFDETESKGNEDNFNTKNDDVDK